MTKQRSKSCGSLRRNIAVMGAAKTGKTSLIARFLGQPFEEQHKPTVEDYYFERCYVGESLYHIDITDTSGSFEFPAMERLTIDKADAFILVYSLEDEASFEQVKMYLRKLKAMKDITTLPIIVVCNKADLADVVSLRNVQMRLDSGDLPLQCLIGTEVCTPESTCSTKEQILYTQLEHVREVGCEFLLTSAKYRWNVNRIFQQLFTERKTESTTKKKSTNLTSTIKLKVMRKRS